MLSRGVRQLVRSSPRRQSPCKTCLTSVRFESTNQKSPTSSPKDNSPKQYVIPEENFMRNTAFTLDFFRRLFKFSAIGLLTIGITTFTAFEGAHLWVENVELAPETDEDARKWQWDLEAERWTGGPAGGTDPALGFMGRHAVRSAWIALNWGTGSGASVLGPGPGPGGLHIVDSSLEFAHNFLHIAIRVAMKKSQSDSEGSALRPETINELLTRHAQVLERMCTRDALYEARSEYESVWAGLSGKGLDAARVALKVGDLDHRLGECDVAQTWWAKAIHLAHEKAMPASIPPTIPQSLPSSPLAQRTLISTLVSLSTCYSTSGQLRQAEAVQELSLDLLRSIRSPQTFDSGSPAQVLHALFVLHRSSVLSVHHAEVLYALRTKPVTSMEWLSRAAESAERVALTLTGLPLVHPDAPGSHIPHPPSSEASLIPEYSKSVSMKKPARNLLRDARRTAAESWNLLGILRESSEAPDSMEKALECYERALGWAGVASDRAGGIGKAGEGTLETEWKAMWNNYVRAREMVKLKKEASE